MNKKVKTLIFILSATTFNILITILFIVLFAAVYIRFFERFVPLDSQGQMQAWPYVVIFIGAIALSFVAYRFALRLFLKKVDVEKHFDPLFGSRRK